MRWILWGRERELFYCWVPKGQSLIINNGCVAILERDLHKKKQKEKENKKCVHEKRERRQTEEVTSKSRRVNDGVALH